MLNNSKGNEKQMIGDAICIGSPFLFSLGNTKPNLS